MFFKNSINIFILLSYGVSINFFFWISLLFFLSGFFTYQLHHYSNLTYQFHHHYSSTSSWFINLVTLSFWVLNLLTASILFLSFWFFLVIFLMQWILVAVYMIKDMDNFYSTRYLSKLSLKKRKQEFLKNEERQSFCFKIIKSDRYTFPCKTHKEFFLVLILRN